MFWIALLTVAGLFVTSAGSAFASEVEVRPGPASEGPWAGLLYRAAPGEANRVLLVTVDDATIDVSDLGAPIAPGRGCRAVDVHLVRCSTAAFPGRLGLIGADVRAGDMDDVVETRGRGLSADGGPEMTGWRWRATSEACSTAAVVATRCSGAPTPTC